MPQIQSQIITKDPNPLTQPYATHEDIYGKGGYVAITTTVQDPNINNYIIEQRRKVGMMVYDIRMDKFYICDNVLPGSGDDNWTPVAFGGTGGTDSVGATTLSELTDVSLDLPLEDDNILIYDVSTDKWKNVDLLTHFNFPVNTAGELDIATNTSIEILIDIINNLELIANIQAGNGISVVTDTNNVSTISLNATLGNLTNVSDSADTLGSAEDFFLKWENGEWVPAPIKIVVEGSTDSTFAQYNEPFITWLDAKADLPNSLLLSDLLTPGYGITIESGTNSNLIFSLDQNIVVLYEDMPQYTDGSLDVARQSTLESLVDLLNSFGSTDCPVGGGGILTISGGTNINITGTASVPVINVDSNIINSTYNGLNIERPALTENLLLSYPDSSGNANISIEFAQSFGATFSTENPGLNLYFRDVSSGKAGYQQNVAYIDDLHLSKLFDVVIETDLVAGSILTYVDDGYWTNTNEINGGNANSF